MTSGGREGNDTVQERPIRLLPGDVMDIRPMRFALIVGALLAAPSAFAGTKLLRFPDVCGDRVVFTYAGDLWTASTQGGTAARITAGPGLEQSARFSPDCSHIA